MPTNIAAGFRVPAVQHQEIACPGDLEQRLALPSGNSQVVDYDGDQKTGQDCTFRDVAVQKEKGDAIPTDEPVSENRSPATPLRVLHIIYGLQAGGAEALLCRLTERPGDISHEVVSLIGPDWYSEELAGSGIRLHHLCIHSSASALGALPRLWRIMRQSRADVVQTWMYRSNVYGGLVAWLQGKPVVWGIHTGSLEPLRFAARFWAYAGGLIARFVPDFVIHCSTSAEQNHARIGYAGAAGAVIPNGYDPATYFPDDDARLKLRKELGVAPETFLLGFIRRWAPAKDVPTLVRALRLVRDRGIPFKAIFVGSGLSADNPDLVELIEEEGCKDAITLLGRRSDVPGIARAIDLHLLSSLVEAFPNIVGETMLSGTPNVVTDVGDCALMVGDTGWVVPPGIPEKLADAIADAYREWKDSPGNWDQRRLEARRLIAERFTFDRMAEAYEEVWRTVARREPAAAALARLSTS